MNMMPRSLVLMKLCVSDALCDFNRSRNDNKKLIFEILQNAREEMQTSYKTSKKIKDTFETLERIIQKLMKICQKLRVQCRTERFKKKKLEIYKAYNFALKKLLTVHNEMTEEMNECC